MSEATRIADQLRRAFDGDAWHGVVQHELYHAGQIALLKKM